MISKIYLKINQIKVRENNPNYYQRWSRDAMLRDRDETRRDFGIPRRDMRLYISCFSLNPGCGLGFGSRSVMFLFGSSFF